MPQHHNRPKESPQSCARCKGKAALTRCCLTGSGDHPRYFFLCPACLTAVTAKSPTANAWSASTTEMSERDMNRETRLQKALDRLGTDNPVCACCIETDPFCMELHHLEGERFGKTLVILCRNCHRKLSDAQKDQPQPLGEPPKNLESVGHFLQGLADLFLLLAQKLWEFGEYLIEQASAQKRKSTP